MTMLTVPAYIERSKIGGAPLGFEWKKDQYDFGHGFSTLGERTPIVRKLELISMRGTLGLLAASAEWLVYRLAGPDDPFFSALVSALWVGSVDPRLVNLAVNLPPGFDEAEVHGGLRGLDKTDPAKGPILKFASTVQYCYGIALEFDGAFHSYAEGALRLVDYVMPNTSYSNWRRACYGHLAAQTSSHTRQEVRKMIKQRQEACGAKYDSAIIEQIIANDELDDLWGPALPREAYDPKATPPVRSSAEILADFLRQARTGDNPFLHPVS